MKTEWPRKQCGRWTAFVVASLSCVALLIGPASGRESDDDEGDDGGKIPLTVTKAVCGPEDHPEIALQLRDVQVAVDTVDALQLEDHMAGQDIGRRTG